MTTTTTATATAKATPTRHSIAVRFQAIRRLRPPPSPLPYAGRARRQLAFLRRNRCGTTWTPTAGPWSPGPRRRASRRLPRHLCGDPTRRGTWSEKGRLVANERLAMQGAGSQSTRWWRAILSCPATPHGKLSYGKDVRGGAQGGGSARSLMPQGFWMRRPASCAVWRAGSNNDDPKWREPRQLDPSRRIEIAGRICWVAGWID